MATPRLDDSVDFALSDISEFDAQALAKVLVGTSDVPTDADGQRDWLERTRSPLVHMLLAQGFKANGTGTAVVDEWLDCLPWPQRNELRQAINQVDPEAPLGEGERPRLVVEWVGLADPLETL